MADTAVGGDIITSNFQVGSRYDLAMFKGRGFGQCPMRYNINIDGQYTCTDVYGNSTVDFFMQGFSCNDRLMNMTSSTGGVVSPGSVTVIF